ncbi:glycoside hydrolase family 2 protein [Chitinophaga filiformis]|uniref:Glycosyl hydrolases family 2, TIM barrel domain n=1 Tax=Chitinophaga filiformis TaxID=104663 RepID=A0A1G7HVY6_CHIFI|nr:sugar-binding domain-containing protein [Chitinophaga filiformis]SDF04518.1 Glycosyl hydrolases family 2, TIM barrel domain [Chitinophaga filiformis]
MIRISIHFIIGILLLGIHDLKAQGKGKWQIQATSIQTRWASDVNPDCPLPEYPRPQLVRNTKWENLNGLWNYAITSRDSARPVRYIGQILVPYPLESALSGVKRRLSADESLWYQRNIRLDPKGGVRTLLHFGAVDWRATVWVNGKEVGSHTGGYTEFTLDITSAIKNGNNDLVVKVYDPTDQGYGPHGKQLLNPSSIYYTANSGIWQTVWLEIVPEVFITSLAMTPDIDSAVLKLNVKTNIDIPMGYSIQARVGNVQSDFSTSNLSDGLNIRLGNAHLWSPEDPYLYSMNLKLIHNDKVIDSIDTYFGMRKIEIRKDEKGYDRIFLNNKYTYNLGILDQGYWPEGLYTSPTDEALMFDIKASKAMGFNTIRKHMKIEPARWYFHADRLGMLVWQDFVSPNQKLGNEAKSFFETQIDETINQLYSHPCITTWIIFNEKWGQYDQQRITEKVKKLDPSRLVNGHSGELLYVDDQLRSPSPNAYISSDMTDVHSYPIPRNALPMPGKARVLGEFGGIGVPVEDHLWDDLVAGWGYDGVVQPEVMKSKYRNMVDSINSLKQEGLSASIYTQLTDVESEQNGLITYDRALIKVPLPIVKKINEKIWPSTWNRDVNDLKLEVAEQVVMRYSDRIKEYRAGRNDSTFLRNLTIMANANKDYEMVRMLMNDYLHKVEQPLSSSNLKYILKFVQTDTDYGFEILLKNRRKINILLGADVADSYIVKVLSRTYIDSFNSNIDSLKWSFIEKKVIPKYGVFGEEAILQSKVLYAVNNQDVKLFDEVVDGWYKNYGRERSWIGPTLLNNIAWFAFERSSNNNSLKTALQMSKISMEKVKDAYFVDTYANLLFKLGLKDQAIEWERKAIDIEPNDDVLKTTLDKMESNKPTWK